MNVSSSVPGFAMMAIVLGAFFSGCNKDSNSSSQNSKRNGEHSAVSSTEDNKSPSAAGSSTRETSAGVSESLESAKPAVSETTAAQALSPTSSGELVLTPSATPAANLTESSSPTSDTGTSAVIASADSAETSAASESDSPPSAASATYDFAQSPSPYLRLAAKSELKWRAYTADSFELAAKQDRPVLIDIGANWSHLCRRMNAETYTDPEVMKLLSNEFTIIKVDRDERPEVEERYQAAYRLINGKKSDYPLTVFALPDGRPFDILSFVPAKGNNDQAGMADLLEQVLELYNKRKAEAEQQAGLVEKGLEKEVSAKSETAIDSGALKSFAAKLSKENTPTPLAAAPSLFLLQHYSDAGDKVSLESASTRLLETFRSGFRDHVLGGYFRPSVSDGSVRFEKLLPIQSELLASNALAYAATRKKLHLEAVTEILRFCKDTLEIEGGGFYSSQESGIGPEDEGAYFTWSTEEIEKLGGSGAASAVFASYLNAGNEPTNLHVTQKLQAAADAAGLPYNDAVKALDSVRMKLRDARMGQEQVPYVNKAVIVSWNADMINAYLEVYKNIGDSAARDFALLTADSLINNVVSEKHGVARMFYKSKASGFGYLDDNVKLASALMNCFQVSGLHEYLDSAKSIMEYVEARFLDKQSGLYFDRIAVAEPPAGFAGKGRSLIQDREAPCGNAIAAMVWYQLHQAQSDDKSLDRSNRIIKAAATRHLLDSADSSTLARAAAVLLNSAPKVLIIGNPDDEATKQMHEAALPVFRMGKLVEKLSPEQAAKTDYPPAKDGKPIAYVCTSKNCAPPIRDAGKLAGVVKSFGRAVSSTSESEGTQNSAERSAADATAKDSPAQVN